MDPATRASARSKIISVCHVRHIVIEGKQRPLSPGHRLPNRIEGRFLSLLPCHFHFFPFQSRLIYRRLGVAFEPSQEWLPRFWHEKWNLHWHHLLTSGVLDRREATIFRGKKTRDSVLDTLSFRGLEICSGHVNNHGYLQA